MTGGLTLTPRQARTALDVLTGIVVVSVAFALAGLTWRIAGHAGTGAITVPSGRSAPVVAPDIGPAVALAPFGKMAVGEATRPTTLPLVLRGVFAADPASLSVAYISVSGAEPEPFRIGETVSGGTIEGILRDRVVLNVSGSIEYLAFPDPALTPEAQAAAAQQAQSAAQQQPPAAPPASPVAASAAGGSPSDLLRRFDASPVDGGFRVGENAPPGLVAGDIIQSLNGSPLTDPAAAATAIQSARASGSAQVTLLRNGQPVTLTVPLR